MKLFIDIARHLSPQFAARMGGEALPNGFVLHPDLGSRPARCTFIKFPGALEFYHFGLTQFREPLQMQTINHPDSEWYLIHINLSNVAQKKRVNDEQISFHRHLPIGILFCGQGLEMNTTIPAGVDAEVASIRFSKTFQRDYFANAEQLFDAGRSIAYEDLDELLERKLLMAIGSMNDKISCHAHILEFLSAFFKKLGQHDQVGHLVKCHPQDLENIFKVSEMLRNPLEKQAPTIRQLAKAAHMSPSKFKDLFRKVFGKPPLAYRNKIRMEYARNALQSGDCTPTEISYRLGFAHPSNFTAAYKRYFQGLPSSA